MDYVSTFDFLLVILCSFSFTIGPDPIHICQKAFSRAKS